MRNLMKNYYRPSGSLLLHGENVEEVVLLDAAGAYDSHGADADKVHL